MSDAARVAVVGAGSIGVAWAVVFARGGCAVALQDPDPARLQAAPGELAERIDELAAAGLLDEPAADLVARVRTTGDLADAVAGAAHVQECAPERLELKQELFAAVAASCPPDAVLASSSSAISASRSAAELPSRERCLVVHPANPPHLLPVVEVVPAPFTDGAVVARTTALLERCGMSPVVVQREVEGFVYNRLQGALLREAYCLVRDGVADVDAVDRIVREGLGRRWAVVGPFETVDLNTRGGIEAHAAKLGPAYERMGAERGQHDPWTPELVADVTRQRRALLPLEEWDDRVRWRDAALVAQEAGRRRSA